MGTIFVYSSLRITYILDTANKVFNPVENQDLKKESWLPIAETNNQYIFSIDSQLKFINKTTMATEHSIDLGGTLRKPYNTKGTTYFYCTIDYKPKYIK